MEWPENRGVLFHINVLVDGPFIEELKSVALRFKGLSNQRTIERLRGLLKPRNGACGGDISYCLEQPSNALFSRRKNVILNISDFINYSGYDNIT